MPSGRRDGPAARRRRSRRRGSTRVRCVLDLAVRGQVEQRAFDHEQDVGESRCSYSGTVSVWTELAGSWM